MTPLAVGETPVTVAFVYTAKEVGEAGINH